MTTGIAVLLVVFGAGIMKVLVHVWSGSRKDQPLPSSAKMVPFGSLEEGAVFVHFSPPHEYVRPIVLRKNGKFQAIPFSNFLYVPCKFQWDNINATI